MEQSYSTQHDLTVAIPLLSSSETSFSTNTIDQTTRIRAIQLCAWHERRTLPRYQELTARICHWLTANGQRNLQRAV